MVRRVTLAVVMRVIALMLVSTVLNVRSEILTIEGEEMEIRGRQVNYRSGASSDQTVQLFKGDTIYFDLCLMSGTFLYVDKVIYSNDGPADQIEVMIDNHPLGMFETTAVMTQGAGWNQFRSSGDFSKNGTMIQGRHRVALSVLSSDQYGVEIDYILMNYNGSQSVTSLKCGVFCFEDISYTNNDVADAIVFSTPSSSRGFAVQKSHPTDCAEEDNINIPVFHDYVSKYEVVAHLPKYMSFSNNRGADWTHCQMVQSFWAFTNVDLDHHAVNRNGSARLSYHPNTESGTSGHIGSITVTFGLNGSSIGSTDAEIGTNVFLKGISFPGPVKLKFRYLDRHMRFSTFQEFDVDPANGSAVFTTPDYTFRETDGNIINIEIYSCSTCTGILHIDNFYMFKRNIYYDNSTLLYKDGTTILEGVNMDMWWRVNETMTVTIADSGRTFGNVDYIRVYQRLPWGANSYSQIFVMYQDGNVRLLPITPHGLDWIPFGSSVLIGQTDPNEFRPSAPIFHVEFDPQKILKIHYLDGGTTTLQIKTSIQETRLLITDSLYVRNPSVYPFFTFRSMWVTDGNGDVDTVTVDGSETRPILGNWDKLYGNYFAFYRKCISKHNTLSPDIILKIIQ